MLLIWNFWLINCPNKFPTTSHFISLDYLHSRFKNLNKIKESVLSKTPKEAKVNYGIEQLVLVTDVIYSLLAKGLGNRVDLILQMVEADLSWPVKKSLQKARSGWATTNIFRKFIVRNNCNILIPLIIKSNFNIHFKILSLDT